MLDHLRPMPDAEYLPAARTRPAVRPHPARAGPARRLSGHSAALARAAGDGARGPRPPPAAAAAAVLSPTVPFY